MTTLRDLVAKLDDAFALPGSYGTLALARRAWADVKAALVDDCDTQQAHPRCAMCDKPIPAGCKDCTEYAIDSVGAQQAQPEMPESVRSWLTDHALTRTMVEDAERIANIFPAGDERRENVIRLTYFARGVLRNKDALTPEQMLAFRA